MAAIEVWEPTTHPFWHGSAPMSYILNEAGPADMWVRGEGAWLIDASGRRYLDGRSGVGNMLLGYGRRDIAEAMFRQATELPFVCTMRRERSTPIAFEYAEALAAAAPPGLTRVRFAHTGSSAVESAILMARSYQRNLGRTDKDVVVGLRGAYHGTTMTTMAVSGLPVLHLHFRPMPAGFKHIPAPRSADCPLCQGVESNEATCADRLIAALESHGMERMAAVVVEPVNAVSGVPRPDHYLRALRDLCSRQGILLIFDEVFTGFGRMGKMFASELSGVLPDIMCLAKGITAGYAPLGAVVTTDEVYDVFNASESAYFAHASSTDGHPVSCAAGLATLKAFLQEDIVARGAEMGERLRGGIAHRLAESPLLAHVRAIGAYIAVDLVDFDGRKASMLTKRYLDQACEERGILIDYTPETVMIIPPLILTADEADLFAGRFAETVLSMKTDDVSRSSVRPGTLRGHR